MAAWQKLHRIGSKVVRTLALWTEEGVCFSVKEKLLLVSFSSHVMSFLYKAFPLPLNVSLLGML